MPVALRQSLAVGKYLMTPEAQAATRSTRCSSSSSRSSSATWPARSAGRSSTRSTSSSSACRSSRRSPRSRSAARRWCRSPAASRSCTPRSHVLVEELIKRKKFVFLCTNGILMKKKLDIFKPSPYFTWVVHLDGMRERHDQFVEREGIFDKCVDAIKEAKERGFRVNTNTTFLTTDTPKTVRDVLDFLNDELKVDQMQISPAYAYEKAPDQEHFPGVTQTRKLFQRGVRRRQAQAVAPQPHAALPRLPRGQGRLPVHAVGHPELLDLRLAAAVLPDERRLREDVQGADRGDRLVEVRPRATTSAATTAWRTAATSRPPCSRRRSRSSSRCARCSRAERASTATASYAPRRFLAFCTDGSAAFVFASARARTSTEAGFAAIVISSPVAGLRPGVPSSPASRER